VGKRFLIVFLSLRFQLLFLLCFPPEGLQKWLKAWGLKDYLLFKTNGDFLTLLKLYIPGNLFVLTAQEAYDEAKSKPDNERHKEGSFAKKPTLCLSIAKGLLFEMPFGVACLLLAPAVIVYEAIDSALQFKRGEAPELFAESEAAQDMLFRAIVAQVMESVFESGAELIVQTHIYSLDEMDQTTYAVSATMGIIGLVQALILLWATGRHFNFIANRLNEVLTADDDKFYAKKISQLVDGAETDCALRSVIVHDLGYSVEDLLTGNVLDLSGKDLKSYHVAAVAKVLPNVSFFWLWI
jgi:hypothetical protein